MAYNIVVDTTKDTNTVKTSKKVIMATKAANRIKDKWAEQGFEISESCPRMGSTYGTPYWSMSLTRWYKHTVFPEKIVGQDTINIIYDEISDPTFPNYSISAYHHSKGSDESSTFHWNEYLLSLLNEQINCIDDAICILKHPDEMLG